MNKRTKLIVFFLTAILIPGTGPVFAKGKDPKKGTPSGFTKGEKTGWKEKKTPPGWSQGNKKGWNEAEMPPGLSDKRAEVTEDGKGDSNNPI